MNKLINIIGDPVEDFIGRKLPLIEEVIAKKTKNYKSLLNENGLQYRKKNEAIFHQKIANLFDIAKVNVEKYLTDDKKLFLSGQRSKSRFGLIDIVQLSSAEITEDAMDVEPVGKF
ncbi:hypothetical protein KQX54_015225 [Cotesia glomerata]|uniref:Uncharacterized protein n=1 Tax=Cotesia glomerata TaxID=32391 RepID=A0AAV7ISV6_COTGL|nr:hypothetical protein KQX54_015225 [Cotesia glomerata]